MFDVRPGQAYTPTLQFFDANGSPITSGIVGTMTLYAPSSATAVSGPTSVSHQGGGRWGVSFAGSLTTARGTYRWTSSAISGTATLAAQSGTFLVGVDDAWTLRELYTSVRRGLRDGWTGTTSGSGSTSTAVASAFAWGSNNRWLASELYFFEPQSVTDANPVRVTGFAASSGTFTFTPAITSTVSGLDFILGNNEGQGWTHDEVLDAIQTAVRRAGLLRPVTDRVSLAGVSNQYLYSLPNDWVALDGIDYLVSGTSDSWLPISNAYIARGHIGTDGVFGLDAAQQWLAGYSLRLRGRAAPQVPEAMGGYVHGDGATLRDDAIYELLMMSDKPGDRQRAAGMQASVLRARAGAALARMQ
jgi:hypothetical protein